MNLPDILRILQVAFGIGLVIFVHEGGHYIAARLCKVRVEVFSLGFGPKLIGWQRGPTLYQIAAVPLGGFVRMAGEMHDGRREPQPYELHAKSVAQRFFIYSGGVIMNVVLALVLFPLVMSAGVPMIEPVLDAPVKGTPAWHARVPAGTRVLEANGNPVYDFSDIWLEVAMGGKEPARLNLLTPGAETPVDLSVTPEYEEEAGFYRLGVKVAMDEHVRVLDDGPAALAGLRTGDRLLSIEGQPAGLRPAEQWIRGLGAQGPVTVHVERDGEPLAFTVDPRMLEDERRVYGFQPFENRIEDVRASAATAALGIRAEDRVQRVNERPIGGASDLLPALLSRPGPATFEVLRDGRLETLTSLPLDEAAAIALDEDLFLAPDYTSTRIRVQTGGVAERAGVRDGDRVLRLAERPVQDWESLYEVARKSAGTEQTVVMTVQRAGAGGETQELLYEMLATPASYPDFGFGLPRRQYIYRTEGFTASLSAGMTASWRFLEQAWLTLEKMLTGAVSPKNLGGIITISRVSYDWSSQGWAKLFFFLCMLSVNLAFLNVLPIPLLDGGHLFFCIVEAIKGSPVSERTLGYSQVIGLVLILSLMVYVTYNDVVRLFP